jgi:type IV pilus assembly protein PilO
MQFKIPRFESQPRLVQIGIIAAVIAALGVAFYVFYFRGALETRDALKAEVDKLEISIAQGTAVARQAKRFEEELKGLQARLEELRSILPNQKETPEVLRSVQQMAASSNLKIIKFQPQPVLPRTFYSDWPIQLEVQGYYDALGLFFEKIGQATRIINVENIAVKGIEGSTDPTRTLNAVCTATTFVFKEDAVTPATGR